MKKILFRWIPLVCFTFLLICSFSFQGAISAYAAEYYIAPNGSDSQSGTNTSAPLATFSHAMTKLQPGDTLYLMDGTYFQSLKITASGMPGNPVKVKALNDGKAIIDGQKQRISCQVPRIGEDKSRHQRHDIVIEGIRCQNSSNTAVIIEYADRVTLRRVSAYNAMNTGGNYVVMSINFSDDVLVEDCVATGTGRKPFNIYASNNTIFRRSWGKWMGYNDPNFTYYEGLSVYGSWNSLIENVILTKDQNSDKKVAGMFVGVQPYNGDLEAGNDNKFYGNVVYGMSTWGYGVQSNLHGIHGNRFYHNAAIDNKYGFFQRADSDFKAENFTIVGTTEQSFSVNEQATASGYSSKDNDFALKGSLRNSILAYATRGLSVQSSENFVSFDHRYNDLFSLVTPYYGIARKNTGEINTYPGFDTSKYGKGGYLFVPESSAVKNAGENAGQMGAEVLYRYENGTLTNQPLWPWPMEARVQAETKEVLGECMSVTWEDAGNGCTGGLWKTLDEVYPETQSICGDGACGELESCSTCDSDCGSCPSQPFCGDEACNDLESCSTCSSDCGNCLSINNIITAFNTLEPITLDGNLSEPVWNQADYVIFTNPAKSDNQVMVYILYDDVNLYFAYEVIDTHVEAIDEKLYKDDGVEIYLDTAHDATISMNGDDYHFLANTHDQLSGGNFGVHTSVNASGYIMEMAIPWTEMSITPTADQVMGILLGNNDQDPSTSSGQVTTAQFDWNGLVDTGSYARPYLWGDLILSSQSVGNVATDAGSGDDGGIGVPVPDFTADMSSGPAPLAVQFTDTSSKSPTAWWWEFGDGATSPEQSPSHVYQADGTYSVKLWAANIHGGNGANDFVQKTGFITVNSSTGSGGGGDGGGGVPVPNFTANVTSGAAPLAVQFTDTSSHSPTAWWWEFGDGATSAEQSPSHVYQADGTYSVKLWAANAHGGNGANDFAQKTGFITVNSSTGSGGGGDGGVGVPVPNFIVDSSSGPAPLAVQFTDTSSNSPTTWWWEFGDGATSVKQSPSHVYQSDGTYSVKLWAANAHGGNGANDFVEKTGFITVNSSTGSGGGGDGGAAIPVPDFTVNISSGPAPLAVQFSDTSSHSPTAWWWEFGDGATSPKQNPSHVYQADGTYSVKFWASNAHGGNVANDFVQKTGLITVSSSGGGGVVPAHCSDGKDNDGDGKTDLADPGCASVDDNDEFNVPASGNGIVYYVDVNNGSDGNDGKNNPFKTIQKAANVAKPGDTVIVKPGIYKDTNNDNYVVHVKGGTADKWITFRSEVPWGAVVEAPKLVDRPNTHSYCWNFTTGTSYVLVEGFDVTGCSTGFNVNNSNTNIMIKGNHIHDIGRRMTDTNSGQSGISYGTTASDVTIDGNVFHTIGRFPGGVHPPNHDHGIYVRGNNAKIMNNVFYDHTSGWAIHIYSPGNWKENIEIINNTFADPNPARDGHIVITGETRNVLIQNNIFSKPRGAMVRISKCYHVEGVTIQDNLTDVGSVISGTTANECGWTSVRNKLSTKPLFLDAGKRDYRLKSSSPAIDSGLATKAPVTDYSGNSRPQGAGYDIGAYEFSANNLIVNLQGTPPEEMSVQLNVNKPASVTESQLTLAVYDADFPDEGELYVNGNGPIILFGSDGIDAHDATTVPIILNMPSDWWVDGANTLRFVHTKTFGYDVERMDVVFQTTIARTQCNDGIDNDGDGEIDLADLGCTSVDDDDEFNAPTTGSGAVYYVDANNGSDTNDGINSPFKTIQKAANIVKPGDTVIVRDGVYSESAGSGEFSQALRITKSGTSNSWITFKSENKWGAVLDGKNNAIGFGIVSGKDLSYVRIEGFEIKGYKYGGVHLNQPNNKYIYVYNNHIHHIGRWNSTGTGLDGIDTFEGIAPNYTQPSSYITIDSNVIHDIGKLETSTNFKSNHDHGVYLRGHHHTLTNNIFYNNRSGWSILLAPQGSNDLFNRVANNTIFADNANWKQGSSHFGGIIIRSSSNWIENNIIIVPENKKSIGGAINYYRSGVCEDNVYIRNNLTNADKILQDGAGNCGNAGLIMSNNLMGTDPLLAGINMPSSNPADYQLLVSTSPAIDAGLADNAPSTDYAGNNRPQGSGVDIGAYEFSSGDSNNVIVNLQGTPPEEMSVQMNVIKPLAVTDAELTLMVYDADFPEEGELYVNGNGPIILFGSDGIDAHDVTTVPIILSMPADWWVDGVNTLRFVHTKTFGYDVESMDVVFKTINPGVNTNSYYVSVFGNDAGDGSSDNPWRTPNYAIGQLSAGDTLHIKSGTYGPVNISNLNGTVDKPITIKNFGNDVVTVDAYHNQAIANHAMVFNTSSHIIVDGLRLTDSDPQVDAIVGLDVLANFNFLDAVKKKTGNGIKFHDSHHMTIQNSDIFHTGSHGVNTTSDIVYNISVLNNTIHTGFKGLSSYGVYLKGDNNIIKGNTIYNNTGYGLHLNSSKIPLTNSVIENNVIYDNGGEAWLHVTSKQKKVGGGGAILWNGTGNTFQNNIFYYTNDYRNNFLTDEDTVSDNLIIAADTNTIVNNTIYGAIDVGTRFHSTRAFDNIFRNNIIWRSGGSAIGYTASATQGKQTLSNNLTTKALFVNNTKSDFRLQETSDAIDAGTSLDAPSMDINGNKRPQGSAIDIGAYEFGSATGGTPTPDSEPTPGPTPAPMPTPTGNVYYVSPKGSDTNSGKESFPFKTIQKAATVVQPGGTVIVKPGVYKDTDGDNFVVRVGKGGTSDKWVTFRSEIPWKAVVDGPNLVNSPNKTSWCWNFSTGVSYVRVEGFDVTGCSTAFNINNENKHITIRGNHIHDVGRRIVSISGAQNGVTIGTLSTHVIVDGNVLNTIGRLPGSVHAENHDHMIYLRGKNVTISNNVFYNHKAGWAVHIYHPGTWKEDIKIVNNTFADPNPSRDGHIIITTKTRNVLIQNNIFSNPKGAMIRASNGCYQVENITVQDNLTNAGAIYSGVTADQCGWKRARNKLSIKPFFVDASRRDYRLQSKSPAIDSGLATNAPVTDYFGNSRPQGSGVDIGAYEFGGSVNPVPKPEPTPTPDSTGNLYSMIVNPSFDSASLSPEMKKWYDRLWQAIGKSRQEKLNNASSGDLYQYGRTMNVYITSLLTALRTTGDPKLLDEVYLFTEKMRKTLKDWSILSRGGSTFAKDGYLNWTFKRQGEGDIYKGTDLHVMEEFLTHANVAGFTYAFHLNQNVDTKYKEARDFWVDYLVNHFEAKWRKRKNISTGPFLHYSLAHPYTQSIRYYYYMYKMTGTAWYLEEAERKAAVIDAHMLRVKTLTGTDGLIWDHRVTGDKYVSNKNYWGCQPQTYTDYTMQAAGDLAFEGLAPFSRSFMARMANTLNDNQLFEYPSWFKDVCGGVATAGLNPSQSSRPPFPKGTCGTCVVGKFTARPHSHAAAWGTSTETVAKSLDMYNIIESDKNSPSKIFIPVAMLLRDALVSSIGGEIFTPAPTESGPYTVTHVRGTGQFAYDAATGNVKVSTGDNVGLQFAKEVTATHSGTFKMNFKPTVKYPKGGIVIIRLKQNANNYYEIENTDGYGAGFVRKVIGGQTVENRSFIKEYAQGNSYPVVIGFSPAVTTVNAFGDQVILNADSNSIMVNSFEVAMSQQDADFSNIIFSDTFTPLPIPAPTQCSDGIDNDGDGLIDHPADPGCFSLTDDDEFNAPTSGSGTIYYVDANNGSDTNDGIKMPFKTIQKAANIVKPGDTVIVRDGVYTDTDNDNNVVKVRRGGTASNYVTLKSENKNGAIIDGEGRTTLYGFLFGSNVHYVKVEGFEFKNMKDTAVVINSANHDVIISNNTIHHIGQVTTSLKGGQNGIYSGSNTYNITIDSNYIYEIGRDGTSTNHDHGVYISGNPAARDILIVNNIFRNRSSGWPIHIYSGTGGTFLRIKILNNTFYGQNVTRDGQILMASSAKIEDLLIENNIFSQSRGAGISSPNCAGKKNVTIRNNLTDNARIIGTETCGFTYSNNITKTDPLLINPDDINPKNANYQLKGFSFAIDAGLADNAPSIDHSGNNRPQGSGIDIGAYEFIEGNGSNLIVNLQGTPPEEKSVQINANKPASVTEAQLTLAVYDADFPEEGELYVNGNGPIILFGSDGIDAHDVTTVPITLSMPADWWIDGVNTLRFVHTKTFGYGIESIDVIFQTTNPEINTNSYYVSVFGSDTNNDGSSDNPWRTPNYAIRQLSAGDTLYIKAGTYGSVYVSNIKGTATDPITIKNFGNDVVTIDRFATSTSNRIAMVFNNSSYVIIDGLNITDSDPDIDKAVGLDPNNAADKKFLNGIGLNGIKFSDGCHHMTVQNSDISHTGSHGILGVNTHNLSIINNLIHTGIKAVSSYGIYIVGEGNIIRGNKVYQNTGYGLHLATSSAYFNNSIIENNVIYDNGGDAWLHVSSQSKHVGEGNLRINYGTGNTIQNNVLYYSLSYQSKYPNDNVSDNLVIAANKNTIVNNTMYNALDVGVRFHSTRAFDNIFRNNIIWRSRNSAIGYTSSAIQGKQTLSHNLTTKALFVNNTKSDFRLQSTSDAIDAGTSLDAPSMDINGNKRPQGLGVDIGAYEFRGSINPTPDPAPTPAPTPTPTPTGNVYYVSPKGSNTNSGKKSFPFKTIQKAATVVRPGDTVIVKDGVYKASAGASNLLEIKRGGSTASGPVVFRSENKWGAKMDASGAVNHAININKDVSFVRIEGFEIMDAPNAAIKFQNRNRKIEIIGNNIHGSLGAAAISVHGAGTDRASELLVDGNFIHHNGDSLFRKPGQRGYDDNNQNKDHGIYMSPASAIIRNNVFTHHEHGWAIQFSEGAENVSIYNNVFAHPNPNRNGYIMFWQTNKNIFVKNNIFFKPRGHAIADHSLTATNIVIKNNLTTAASMTDGAMPSGVILGNNLLKADPMFIVPKVPTVPVDFQLQRSSPAIDTGVPLTEVPWDYNRNIRPRGAGYDIGAYEF